MSSHTKAPPMTPIPSLHAPCPVKAKLVDELLARAKSAEFDEQAARFHCPQCGDKFHLKPWAPSVCIECKRSLRRGWVNV